ncbi:MAG TPA: SDR family NAD(P)-dependent oxidoreductase, partial [Mycobacteriales bacterium]|nr:SDR family NAD(P)-dependent oxidoreductase [Mycobacteriales bacterium]
MRFTGKVAVVTGAAQGIGAATARLLAAEGASVGIVDLTAERGQPVVDEITTAGGVAVAFGCDVSDQSSVDRMAAAVVERFGRLDILVNN